MTEKRRGTPAWIDGLRPRGLAALAFGAGAAAGLGIALQGVSTLQANLAAALAGLLVFLPALLRAVARAQTPGRGFLLGWAGGTGWFLVALNWIYEPFLVDVTAHGWMAPFAVVFMAAGMALFWGVAGWLTFRATRWGSAAPGPRIGLFAGLLALAEMARGVVFTGFPWAQPGHLLIEPLVGWAAVTGPLGLTVLALGGAAILAVVSEHGGTAGRLHPPLAAIPVGVVVALGYLAAPTAPRAADEAALVRIVQPNAPQHLKWDLDHRDRFIRRALEATAEPGDPDLVVWPEMTITYALDWAGPVIEAAAEAADGAPLLAGVPRRDEDGQAFNTAILIGPEGRILDRYDKHHLVPFGEYIPFAAVLGRFGIAGLADETGFGYAAGPGPANIAIDGIGAAFVMICYEAIFPRYIRRVERPEVMLHITNDAWFGALSGPYQHLALARLRAAEQGIPVIRAANTGVSALIDARGRVLDSLPLGEAGYLDVRLPPPLPPTLYARTGDWPAILAALMLASLSLFMALRQPVAAGAKRD